MDRRIKERLIGATILVALIVLIVPELLSGPKPAPVPPLAAGLPGSTRNVSVNLATSKATPEPQAADAAPVAAGETPAAGAANVGGANAGGTSAGGASTGGTSGGGTSAATVTTLRAQEPAAPLETSVSSPKSGAESTRAVASREALAQGRQGWTVQLGSFASRANAEKLLHQLPGNGFYVISSGSGPSLRYRVRIGPFTDRSAAARAVTKLKTEGHAATIVTPAS
ncbi:MAG: SPOR domain-containing protein [Steroidobacteraceae bacterium]|jgi:DedD protein